MSEQDSIAFFLREMAAHARSLPVAEAVAFMRGALVLIGDKEVGELSTAYIRLKESDAQLELIASGQLKLNLGGDAE